MEGYFTLQLCEHPDNTTQPNKGCVRLMSFFAFTGGRGTTERFRRNWTHIDPHAALKFFLPDADLATFLSLSYPHLLLFMCQCCMYIITIYVLYYSELYYPVMFFHLSANCGLKSLVITPLLVLMYYTPLTLWNTTENNVATT